MLQNYTPNELEFREFWINYGFKAVPEKTQESKEILAEMFDKSFERGVLEIENTQSAETHEVPADTFFMNARKRFILNESGTLTFKHSFKLGVIIPIIERAIKIRQIKKKAKIKAAEANDTVSYGILNNEEYTLKIVINGFYGLFLYLKSIFFNPSVGATVTAAGRNVISTSALTVENIGGGYRSYLIEAHLQIINIAKEETPILSKKYTLPDIDVESVLKHMLLYHYEGYYALSFLRSALEKLTKEELAVVWIKNNFKAFTEVPEVDKLICKIYDENMLWRESLSEGDAKLEEMVLKIFKRNDPVESAKICKSYMCNYAKHPIYGPLTNELKKMSAELLMGFYFYSGDYIEGNYAETSVDIFETMERVKIPTADTDSNVSCIFDESEYLIDKYSKYTSKDEFVREVSTTIISTIILTGSIDYSLDRYTQAVGVSADYSKFIEISNFVSLV
ncbi:MAG: family B DNA polymerase [Sarcina sp.]